MRMFRYICILICLSALYVGCGSRSSNIQNLEGFEDLIALTDSILQYFQQEKFDRIVCHLDEKAKQQLNEEKLADAWASVNAQVGNYKKSKIYSAEKISSVGEKIVFQCSFEYGKIYFQLFFGKDNLVIGLYFKPQPNFL